MGERGKGRSSEPLPPKNIRISQDKYWFACQCLLLAQVLSCSLNPGGIELLDCLHLCRLSRLLLLRPTIIMIVTKMRSWPDMSHSWLSVEDILEILNWREELHWLSQQASRPIHKSSFYGYLLNWMKKFDRRTIVKNHLIFLLSRYFA